jgi:nucleoside-diphosphate-sugar epimerase
MARLAAVTGATGFLGRYIVGALAAAGWQVRVLARQDAAHPQLDGLALQTVRGDLSDRRALDELIDGADAVVHAAGLIKAPNAAAFRAVNVGGTANLVAALNDGGAGKHLLLVSSMVARESGLSAYAGTKRAGENVVATALKPPHEWTIVRPCAIYGPWDKETLAIFQAIARRVFPVMHRRAARAALIHAADAAGAIVSLCNYGPSGRIFELTDRRADGYSWAEIVSAAEAAIGTRALKIPLPGIAVRAVGAMNAVVARVAGRTPMLTLGKAREILHADWGSAVDRLPPPELWQPRVALDAGFRETVSWYRDRRWLPPLAAGQSETVFPH